MGISVRGRDIGDFHRIMTKTPDGNDFVMLSGIAFLNLKGIPGIHWKGESYTVELPPLPHPRKGFYWSWDPLIQWVPLATLAEIHNQRVAENAGWSVNHFDIALATIGLLENQAVLNVGTAVRDVDGFLVKICFHITLIGKLAERRIKGPF
jgi:hypothetical protein